MSGHAKQTYGRYWPPRERACDQGTLGFQSWVIGVFQACAAKK
ncbi:MAG: hypothetical protein WBA06_11035 [Candidatus Aquilonibacter sp.]|jgi:hypothetical protein